MEKKIGLFIFVFATLAASVFTLPMRSYNEASVAEGVDIEKEIALFRSRLESPSFDCVGDLTQLYTRLLAATPQDFAPTPAALADYRVHGVQYIRDLFIARLAVREKLRANQAPACVAAARDIYRAERVLEDLIGMYVLGNPTKGVGVLTGGEPWLLTNPQFGGLKLQSGDVILSRGTAYTSAAIARLGQNDSNFSHLSIVYRDPATGGLATSEAQIETGSFNAPFSKYLGDGKIRAAVFRFHDPAVAAKAASMIRAEISVYQAKNHASIPYDTAMDSSDSSKLFCSELVSHAYALAGYKDLPRYPSTIAPRNRYFVDRIGIKFTKVFLPMDIEVDPAFDLVAEWRDYSQLNTSHLHDAVLTAIYDWMDRYGYVFHDRLLTDVGVSAVAGVRRWPMFSPMLSSVAPACMDADQMELVKSLDQISALMFDHLAAANEATQRETGQPLTMKQMLANLEQYRQQDLALYNETYGLRGSLTRLFRP